MSQTDMVCAFFLLWLILATLAGKEEEVEKKLDKMEKELKALKRG